jgi:hypothetical protein
MENAEWKMQNVKCRNAEILSEKIGENLLKITCLPTSRWFRQKNPANLVKIDKIAVETITRVTRIF